MVYLLKLKIYLLYFKKCKKIPNLRTPQMAQSIQCLRFFQIVDSTAKYSTPNLQFLCKIGQTLFHCNAQGQCTTYSQILETVKPMGGPSPLSWKIPPNLLFNPSLQGLYSDQMEIWTARNLAKNRDKSGQI